MRLGPHTGGFSTDGSFLSSLCILLFIYHLITLRPDLAFNLLVACVLCVSSVIGSVPFGLNGLGPHIGGFSTDGSFLSTPIHLPHSAPPAWLFPPTCILIHSLFIQERRLLHRRTSNTYHLLVTSEQLLLLMNILNAHPLINPLSS